MIVDLIQGASTVSKKGVKTCFLGAALVLSSSFCGHAQTVELPDVPSLVKAAREEAQAIPSAQGRPVAATPAVPLCQVPELPINFTMSERIFSWTDTLAIKSGKDTVGAVKEKFLSWTKTFTYFDARNNKVAEAKERFFSWGTHIDVTDCQGRPIGAIKENVLKSLFKVYTQYSILDASGREIATSEKEDWLSTTVSIHDTMGRLVVRLHRPWINILSDNWDVQILDAAAVDPRLVVMIAAYKTSVDNDRRRSSSSDSGSGSQSSSDSE